MVKLRIYRVQGYANNGETSYLLDVDFYAVYTLAEQTDICFVCVSLHPTPHTLSQLNPTPPLFRHPLNLKP